MLPEEDRATDIGNMQKFGEDQPCGFRVMQADRRTDRQTKSPLPGAK